jgi:hypothetical protein
LSSYHRESKKNSAILHELGKILTEAELENIQKRTNDLLTKEWIQKIQAGKNLLGEK